MDNRYQTFWQRLGAGIIDGFALAPLTYPTTILLGYGPLLIAVAWLVITTPLGFAYTSYCHGRWGRTLGKYATGIQVRRVEDEGRLGYARAIRRDAGTILLSTVGTTILVTFLVSGGDRDAWRMFDRDRFQVMTEDEIENSSTGEVFRKSFSEALPPWQTLVVPTLASLWSIAELVTMFSNPRRRAIHDLIGASVVVRAPVAPYSGSQGSSV